MTNLLLNPGFESGFSNYGTNNVQGADWFDFSQPNGSWAATTNISYNQDTSNQHSGSACQTITIASIPSGGTHYFGQCFSIAAGQSYQAGFLTNRGSGQNDKNPSENLRKQRGGNLVTGSR